MQWYADPARSLPIDLALLRPGGAFALAIFTEGTLAELAEASRNTGFGSVHPMLENDVDELLEAEVQGVRKFQGIPGLVKSNKAFQIVKEEEIHFE